MYLRNTSTSDLIFELKQTYPNPFCIEFDLNEVEAVPSMQYVPIISLDNTHDDYNTIAINAYTKTTIRSSGNNAIWNESTVNTVLGHYKIVIESDAVYRFYINDTLVNTVTNASLPNKGLSIFIGGSRSCRIKNLKIKAL